MSAQPPGPIAAIEREVAMALCQYAIIGGAWPDKAVLDDVQKEWHHHLPAARVAIQAVGDALTKGATNVRYNNVRR